VADGGALPPFDLCCPLLSLPRLFDTTLANLPNEVPYLQPDAGDVKKWSSRIVADSEIIKVGLVWAGNPVHKNDRFRSMGLAALAPLARVPHARFFSLQKGGTVAGDTGWPVDVELTDWTHELRDFGETAALIANLDLVISVDTAVTQLAGAMGKPVWTLLSSVWDWRWLVDRQDCPWYPSMRLFRQSTSGDWNSVSHEVAQALAGAISDRRAHITFADA
jgi:hypothetical protein